MLQHNVCHIQHLHVLVSTLLCCFVMIFSSYNCSSQIVYFFYLRSLRQICNCQASSLNTVFIINLIILILFFFLLLWFKYFTRIPYVSVNKKKNAVFGGTHHHRSNTKTTIACVFRCVVLFVNYLNKLCNINIQNIITNNT